MKRDRSSEDGPGPAPALAVRKGGGVRKKRFTRRLCVICDTNKGSNQFPSSSRVSFHDHSSNVCRHCYVRHVESEIDNKVWDQIACPECSKLLAYEEVKSMANDDYFIKYDTTAMRAAMSGDPDFRYCMASDCGSDQLHPGGTDEPIFRCQACDRKRCLSCEVPWHEGESCVEYQHGLKLKDSQSQADKDSEEKIKKSTKPCPNCKVRIEKNKGCDHMSCTKCRFEFCWHCSVDYKAVFRSGNHMHKKNCKHYRALPQPQAA